MAYFTALDSICSLRGGDMWHMDQAVCQLMTVERLAAWAAHQGVWLLGRKLFASFPHLVFFRCPVALSLVLYAMMYVAVITLLAVIATWLSERALVV